MNHHHMSKRPSHGATHTLRLTFEYRGSHVRLAHVERVHMIAPMPGSSHAPQAGSVGYWIEVRGKKGSLLHHMVLHNPIRSDQEIFSNDPERTVSRQPRKTVAGQFTILVPRHSRGHRFPSLWLAVGEPSEPAQPMARHRFDALRNFDPNEPEGGGRPLGGKE